MDNIDLDILSTIRDRAEWEKYKEVITKSLCTREGWTLVGDIGRWFEQNPQETELTEDFKLWMRVTGHPTWKSEEHMAYGQIIDNVLNADTPEREAFALQLERLRFQANVDRWMDRLRSGAIDPNEFVEEIVSTTPTTSVTNSATSTPTSIDIYDIEDLAAYQRANTGFFWRLEDLNRSVGPIRRGDFIVIAKRPEVGGTSFLASELAFMLEQTPPGSRAIIFSNEEQPEKIYTRMMSCALDVDHKTIMTAPAHYKKQYEKWLDGREFELKHDTQMTLNSIRSKLDTRDYDLVAVNVLMKVGGTKQKEDHDKFQALGEEMRVIAQQHAPVLAIVQADPTAEGMRWIPQDRIYKSKTALQGEADVLIMIGADDTGPLDSRYIHVAKNKIPPAPCTELHNKHIKTEVKFDIGTGRFQTINYASEDHSCK